MDMDSLPGVPQQHCGFSLCLPWRRLAFRIRNHLVCARPAYVAFAIEKFRPAALFVGTTCARFNQINARREVVIVCIRDTLVTLFNSDADLLGEHVER
jgi:hypothetical protein